MPVAHQAALSMGFTRQEYWSGLLRPPAGDLPDPGMEPASLMSPALAGGFFTTSAAWEAWALDQGAPSACGPGRIEDQPLWPSRTFCELSNIS